MKKFAVFLLFFAGTAFAGSADLSWTAPTQNEDGSALTDLAGFKIYYGTTSGAYPNVIDVPDPAATTLTVPNLDPGSWYFVATAYNESGIESQYSNEAVKEVGVPVPEPPTNLVVAGNNLTAYGISITEDVFLTYPVGFVTEGTACNPDMQANGMYLVPKASVEFVGGADAFVVFAECTPS